MKKKTLQGDKAVHNDEHLEQSFLVARARIARMTRGLAEAPLRFADAIIDETLSNTRGESARILELGCGFGGFVHRLTRKHLDCHVFGIDISEARLKRAQETINSSNVHLQVMDMQNLAYRSGCFDVVVALAAIHHVNVHLAITETRRVLKPGGTLVLLEPLGHNSLINVYRRRTPEARFADERPLTMNDLYLLWDSFSEVHCTYFCLFALAVIPIRALADRLSSTKVVDALFQPILAAANLVDRIVFRIVPWCRKYAWKVVVRGVK